MDHNYKAELPPRAVREHARTSAGGDLDLTDRTVHDILRLHAATLDALRSRGIVRSASVVGDYAEWLFARAFNWTLANQSNKSYDAIDAAGVRYQIKARRDVGSSGVGQLGILRNLSQEGFDILAAAIFDADFAIKFAIFIPRDMVVERAAYSDYQRGHIFKLDKKMLADTRVHDVTSALQALK